MIDAFSILWSDLAALRRRWPRYLLTTLMSPLLYLVAFGWGLGRGIDMNGTNYLDFVIPGIIALTAMTTSFNGAGTRLNVDRLYFKSFDECLMAPVGLPSILLGKALIGVVRGLLSSVAFLLVAFLIARHIHITLPFLIGLLLSCLTFAFLGVLAALLARSHEDMATFGSLIRIGSAASLVIFSGSLPLLPAVFRWRDDGPSEDERLAGPAGRGHLMEG